MKFHKIKLQRQKRTWADILFDILDKLFPVKPTQSDLDAYNNVVDPRIHDEILAVRRMDNTPRPVARVTQQLDPRMLSPRQHAAVHQVYPHKDDELQHVLEVEKNRAITRSLKLDEGTHELPAIPSYNQRF